LNVLLWIMAGLGIGIGLLALQRLSRLSALVDRLKRDQYYVDSRLKRVPEDVRETIEPLRHQLAKVAEGGTVPRDMILEGKLFVDVPAEDARTAIEQAVAVPNGNVVVVDVRTPKEYAIKHIPGARLVPFEELDTRYKVDIPEGAAKIFVYCAGGERSRSACDFLSRRGYANLHNIREGLQGWRGATEGEGEFHLVQIQSSRGAGRNS
jgi:rhodanese-related sulfurtransferase